MPSRSYGSRWTPCPARRSTIANPCQIHSAVTSATTAAPTRARTTVSAASAATNTMGLIIGDITLDEMSLSVSARASTGRTKLVAA